MDIDEICRLCCSTKFVNNDIFNEENALYIKLSLYLPIKVKLVIVMLRFLCNVLTCMINDINVY